MRHFALIATLLVAGCATTPRPPEVRPTPVTPVQQARGDLLGMTAGELVQRLGSPVLQIREGRSLKLQFRGPSCILDAYLYPPPSGNGVERVTHVDARLRSGADTDRSRCIAALQRA